MIDINCDVGEGLDNEHLIMPLISSCNISCSAHAGSIETIDKVIELAKQHNVKIGAHPSFPDRENFGRKVMVISDEVLKESIIQQLQLFKERADILNAKVHHVKPHGALYNLIAVNKEKAVLVVKAIQQVFKNIKVYVPYNSEIEHVARKFNIEIVYEAFADRNYNEDLILVSRLKENAILTDSAKVVKHVSNVISGKVKTISGKEIEIEANTFCVHGDNKNALEILHELNQIFDCA